MDPAKASAAARTTLACTVVFNVLVGMKDSRPVPPLPAEPRPGRYRHYKGAEYQVIGIARHSETLEALVVYHPLAGDRSLWVRPAAMFTETVEMPQTGTRVPRFAFVAER